MENPYPPIRTGLFICSSKSRKGKKTSPSQVIASNYSPSIKNICLHQIPKMRRVNKPVVVVKRKQPKEKLKSDGLPPGLCYLKVQILF
jgi:hypothetical protein